MSSKVNISVGKQTRWPCLIAVSTWLLAVFVCQAVSGPIVSTKHGLVEGSRRVIDGQFYEEFLAIPFAQPPVGPLRWAKPQPIEQPWEGVRDATKYSMHCPQYLTALYPLIGYGGVDGEDCLYINVWVPRGVEANQGRKLPVMVFSYGGAYMFGTGEMYPGNELAVRGDVIVVNYNYRLDVLGFFSTGDSVAPGNFGFWDLEATLVWVQENIAQFAGDPTRVTIFGQSAGGNQVSMAVISPKTRGLFNNAIIMSGSISSGSRVDDQSLEKAAMLADIFNCTSTDTSTEIVDCLREVPDPYQLMFWTRTAVLASFGSGFGPKVDGDVLPLPPKEAYELGYGRDVNFMNGYTYHDYAGFMIGNPIALPALGDNGNWAATNDSMYNHFKRMLRGATNTDELIAEIIRRYPEMNIDDVTTRSEATARAMTDWMFAAGVNWEAVAQASFLVGYPAWMNGSHMDDLYGGIGQPFMQTYRRVYLRHDYDDLDREVKNNMMNYYANFAYTGNPNEGPFQVPAQWDQFEPELQNYLHQAPTVSMEQFSSETIDNFHFWEDFYGSAEFPERYSEGVVTSDNVNVEPLAFESPYYFVDLKNRYRLTEKDIERGVQQLRQQYRQQLKGDKDMLVAMEATIDSFVAKRQLLLQQRAQS